MSLSDSEDDFNREASSPSLQNHADADASEDNDAGISQEPSEHAHSDDFDTCSIQSVDPLPGNTDDLSSATQVASSRLEAASSSQVGSDDDDGESEVGDTGREMDDLDYDSGDTLPAGKELLKIIVPPPGTFSKPKQAKSSPTKKLPAATAKVKKGKNSTRTSSPAHPGKSTPQEKVSQHGKKVAKSKMGHNSKGDHDQPSTSVATASVGLSKKRTGPGRPAKVQDVPQLVTKWSVSAYVEVEQPPKVEQKTERCKKKIVLQEPLRLGPLTITHKTTWSVLVADLADVLEVNKENLLLHSLSWRGMLEPGTKCASADTDLWLPMMNASGYDELVETGIKKHQYSRIRLRIAPPKLPGKRKTSSSLPWAQAQSTVRSDCDDSEDEAPPKAKKSKSVPPKKMGLDQQLAAGIDALKLEHPVGRCLEHPGIRCYHDPAGLHFELDNNRLTVWAHALHQHEPGVDIAHPPKNNIFFQADKAIKPRRGHRAPDSGFNSPVVAPGGPYGYQQQWALHLAYSPAMYYPPMMGAPPPYASFPPPSPYAYYPGMLPPPPGYPSPQSPSAGPSHHAHRSD
ncbi:hypothetical protein L226DRAFT_572825 [Lentinus tigrinus ALCF2SS1-7]|uniref:Uncharacterized protein n=1 Tax=Lentinus tigrinus ALCF2SS1-6 TaxID=1328759 RepID=A0A5C2RNS7_9APHY|nr:hypothetical protein L227DRAFT_617112 [Lentinus tigrinus ALCF2SS1-6]RPD72702.1 hypothetical protein L226DRAFT_572825 [Lentinus tigrinus ALCF2SS1-7]